MATPPPPELPPQPSQPPQPSEPAQPMAPPPEYTPNPPDIDVPAPQPGDPGGAPGQPIG